MAAASGPTALRSLHCNSQSLVTFISRTRRPFAVFWIDYHGHRVKYCQLNYAQQFNVRTYETHPWIFRDCATGETLVTADGSDVYMPKQWDGGEAHRCIIGIPMYSLRIRCMQVVRSTLSTAEVNDADIPQTLKEDILDTDKTPHTNHVPHHHHHHHH